MKHSLPHNYISKFIFWPHSSPVHRCCCSIKFLPDNPLFPSSYFHSHIMHNVLSLRSSSTYGFLAKARSNLKRLTLNPTFSANTLPSDFPACVLPQVHVNILYYIPRNLRIRNPNFCCACTIIQNEYFFRDSHLTLLIYRMKRQQNT